jgi:hypothetical protein
LFGILALLCIIIGFVVGGFDIKFVVPALEWFVAAIAFNTLTVVVPQFQRTNN